MRSHRMAFLIAALMLAAGIGAVVARPGMKTASQGPEFSLEAMIPKHFGDWREQSQGIVQVINPQAQKMLDETYNQILTRTYVNTDGYLIMLSIAYGSDQRGPMRAHEPEFCYPGAGFTLHRRQAAPLVTPFGEIPVRRLFTTKGARAEPLTYWVRIGDRAVEGWQWKLVELSYTLTGRIPDGLIFRVSSIDPDQARANQVQDQFINQLLTTASPADRMRLSGLGGR
jgi:EpsI family protein